MTPTAVAIVNDLLAHVRECREDRWVIIRPSELSSLPHPRLWWRYRREIAAWCDAHGHPPLHELVVVAPTYHLDRDDLPVSIGDIRDHDWPEYI